MAGKVQKNSKKVQKNFGDEGGFKGGPAKHTADKFW